MKSLMRTVLEIGPFLRGIESIEVGGRTVFVSSETKFQAFDDYLYKIDGLLFSLAISLIN